MLNKYTFSNNLAVVDLPSIWKIGNGKVSITHASGTNTVNIPSSGYLTVKVGNIFSIQEEDISPIEAIEIENPNPGNNSGNDSGGGSSPGNEGGNSGNGGSSVSGYNPENSGIALILDNKSGENIYITGSTEFYMLTPSGVQWDCAPMNFDITPVSSGEAKYLIPRDTAVVIPPSAITVHVGENEPISKYYGGSIFYDGTTPVNWRLYSFTKNSQNEQRSDPAVIKTSPGSINFNEGGYITYIITGTDEANEGTILRSSNPTNLYDLYPYVQSSESDNNNSGNEGGNSGSESGGNSGNNSGGSGNTIRFNVENQSGKEARFSGKVILNVSHNSTDWNNATQVYANMHAKSKNEWDTNDVIIPNGGTYSWDAQIESYLPDSPDHSTATNGTWYIMSTQGNPNDTPTHSVYLYSVIYRKSTQKIEDSAYMYVTNAPSSTPIRNGNEYNLTINWVNPEATIAPDNSGNYVIQ